MKRRKTVSKSIYRAILTVEKERDEKTGIYISDRFFTPERRDRRTSAWIYIADVFVMFLLLLGLFLLIATGFSLETKGTHILWVGLISAVMVGIFRNEWGQKHRVSVGLAVLIAYLLFLFLIQDRFLQGAVQLLNHIIDTLNAVYSGEIERRKSYGTVDDSVLVLLVLFFPEACILSTAVFWISERMLLYIAVFPLLLVTGLSGVAKNTFALFLILIGMLLCMTYTGTKRQNRMWGGQKKELYEANRLRYQKIRTLTAAVVLSAALILSIPGFLVVRPFLSYTLTPMEKVSLELQSDFLNRMLAWLPKISAGRWNLQTETISGGVSGGGIETEEGYILDEIEDLKITVTKKPTEYLFLRGYVGAEYEDGSWQKPVGTSFDGAALNWNTVGNARLYIQNLAFLRAAYIMNQKDTLTDRDAETLKLLQIEPRAILVEQIHANKEYTYIPYGSFLNDYYQVEAGDGQIQGQEEAEDRYYYYERGELEQIFTEWSKLEGTANVLDRTEESYASYCNKQYLNASFLPEDSEIRKKVAEVIEENKWKVPDNISEITAWIRGYLVQNYSYQQNPSPAENGVDPLLYFIEDSGEGNSVQFASYAVMLYRLFGVPARYVVGYELSDALFIPQADGYSAIAQGNNSQAFVEIYIPGIGWSPEDMTPGVMGTIEEIGPGGTPVEVMEVEGEDGAPLFEAKEEETEAKNEEPKNSSALLRKLNALTMEELIRGISLFVAELLLLGGLIYGVIRYMIDFGYSFVGRISNEERSLRIFRAIYRRMCRLGMRSDISSEDEAFYAFYEELLQKQGKLDANTKKKELACFSDMVQALFDSCYGDRRMVEEDLAEMRRILKKLYQVRRIRRKG